MRTRGPAVDYYRTHRPLQVKPAAGSNRPQHLPNKSDQLMHDAHTAGCMAGRLAFARSKSRYKIKHAQNKMETKNHAEYATVQHLTSLHGRVHTHSYFSLRSCLPKKATQAWYREAQRNNQVRPRPKISTTKRRISSYKSVKASEIRIFFLRSGNVHA